MQGNDKYERFLFRRPLIEFALIFVWWIAKVTSSLHDLLPVSQQSCKTKFRESSVTPESRKLILQTLLKPEFNLTKKLNIVSGYVSIETDRTPSPKNGHAKWRSKQFCKICISYFHLWIRIYSEWWQLFLLLEQSGRQVNIVCGDLLNAEGR